MMTVLVDDDEDDETASLYVVGPDNEGGDGSWWGL
jgi:hypothetical protein